MENDGIHIGKSVDQFTNGTGKVAIREHSLANRESNLTNATTEDT